jgi:hypothetical protein
LCNRGQATQKETKRRLPWWACLAGIERGFELRLSFRLHGDARPHGRQASRKTRSPARALHEGWVKERAHIGTTVASLTFTHRKVQRSWDENCAFGVWERGWENSCLEEIGTGFAQVSRGSGEREEDRRPSVRALRRLRARGWQEEQQTARQV